MIRKNPRSFWKTGASRPGGSYTKGERISVSIHEMVSAERYQLCLDTFYTALPHYQRLHIKLSLQIWD